MNARRLALIAAASLWVAACQGGPAPRSATPGPGPQPDRPSIVLIFADDLGYCDTSLYGCEAIPTPNIESIAEQGVVFTAGYVTAPTCSQSRAGLLTGRYQQRFGYEFSAGGPERAVREELGLPLDEVTLAELLSARGYATGIFGKWHLGMVDRLGPLEQGFDEFLGFRHALHGYFTPPEAIDPSDLNPLLRGVEPVAEADYLTDALTRGALDFIDRHRDRPFFLYLPYNAPHTPLEATEEYLARFASIEDEDERVYAAMVSALDDGVGAILAKLDEVGLGDDTLVWFVSDNGCPFYNGFCSNRPLALGKFFLHEGGVRVPFALRWPARLEGGMVYDEPVSSLDVFPTVAAAAGVPLPAGRTIDGVDLAPYLRGERPGPPHEALYWRVGPNRAVRQGDWKLFTDDRGAWLYRLDDDPGEQHDLAAEAPEVVARLEAALAAWEEELAEPLWPGRCQQLFADVVEVPEAMRDVVTCI